jgi:hypothetical protein
VRLEGEERLDLVARDPVERTLAEERNEADARARFVRGERRALAPEFGEMRQEPAAGFGDREPLRWQGSRRLDQLPKLALRLRPGQPVG